MGRWEKTVVVTPKNRTNNFAIIRFTAALMVMAGHMGYIAGAPIPQLLGRQIQTLGVNILFSLGGYLITKSWLSDPHPLRYGIKRFFRIWPPFAVCVLLSAYIVGPTVSELGREGYFASWYACYLDNLRMKIVYSLPGVFTQNPYPNAVNGSLWTLPVEAAMYIAVPILLSVPRLIKIRRGKAAFLVAVTAGVCFLDWRFLRKAQQITAVVYGTDWISALHIIPFYLMGMLYGVLHLEKYLNLQVAVILTGMFSCLQLSYPAQQIVLLLLLPYLVFSAGLQPEPFFAGFGSGGEISYGMYLYGFPIQQLVVLLCMQNGWQINYNVCLTVCIFLTILAAKLSSVLVEKPMLNVSKKILGWLKSNRQPRNTAS